MRKSQNRAAAHALLTSFTITLFLGEAPGYSSTNLTTFHRFSLEVQDVTPIQILPKSSNHTDEVTGSTRPAFVPVRSTRLDFNWLRPGHYPWKANIVTTVFWVGERASTHNPVSNDRSAWDHAWLSNYGGYDTPDSAFRRNFIPVNFSPRQNPFYIALPYNDIEAGHTKPEAARIVPWFRAAFRHDGRTVLKDRWIEVRHGNRTCFAQWEDCGPFRINHWQYVFGNERPLPNLNQGAGLDVSPAVRDYLGIAGKDVCDWRFVDSREVRPGPWCNYGENNPFVQVRRTNSERYADRGHLLPRRVE